LKSEISKYTYITKYNQMLYMTVKSQQTHSKFSILFAK